MQIPITQTESEIPGLDSNKKAVDMHSNQPVISLKIMRNNIAKLDSLYLCIFFILNFMLADALITSSWQGVHVVLYSVVYIGLMGFIVKIKQTTPTKESWFWLVILITLTISYCFGVSESMLGWQFLLYFFVLSYWVATLFGGLLINRTQNVLLVDLINLFIIIPLKNHLLIFNLIRSELKKIEHFLKNHKQRFNLKSFLAITIISAVLLAIIVPLLISADASEQFSKVFTNLFETFFKSTYLPTFYILISTIFTSAVISIYMIAQQVSIIDQASTIKIPLKKLVTQRKRSRLLSPSSILSVLFIISIVYLLFIVLQAPYLFSALFSKLPENVTIYSEYARKGFFELCKISVINVALIFSAHLVSTKQVKHVSNLKAMTAILAGLTILLIITALSKIALYISVYGFTPDRIKATSFLVYLLLVWSALIIRQFKQFSIARFCLFTGIMILTLLCIAHIEGWIDTINSLYI